MRPNSAIETCQKVVRPTRVAVMRGKGGFKTMIRVMNGALAYSVGWTTASCAGEIGGTDRPPGRNGVLQPTGATDMQPPTTELDKNGNLITHPAGSAQSGPSHLPVRPAVHEDQIVVMFDTPAAPRPRSTG